MPYIITNERGVCFRTALGESLCGSLLCYPLLIWIEILNPSVLFRKRGVIMNRFVLSPDFTIEDPLFQSLLTEQFQGSLPMPSA